jgi:phosphoribosyl 1,2-cyclic phosphate phosphodiesterase
LNAVPSESAGSTGRTSVSARVTFLGTGTSHGVPMIGCECATCKSDDPRDRRLRTSIYLDVPGHGRLLVDTSTDLRQQALTHAIQRVDAILFTHAHADHVMGLDEVRRFNWIQGGPVPCYAADATWQDLRRTFHYAFAPAPGQGGGVPNLTPLTIDGPFSVRGVRVVPVPVFHGQMPVLGFRFGGLAYLTDCSGIPEQSWPLLQNLDVLVLDALRFKPHSTHFNVEQAIAVARRLAPPKTYFTHIGHELRHAAVCADLPPGIELAYDGLSLDVLVDCDAA